MDDRNDIEKAETKFSAALFLFGHGEWHKDANLVYAYSPLVAPCDKGVIEKPKGIFDRSGTHTDTPDKPFRSDVGGNRGQAGIHQAQDKPQQESCNCTNGTILIGGVGFFKTANLTCK